MLIDMYLRYLIYLYQYESYYVNLQINHAYAYVCIHIHASYFNCKLFVIVLRHKQKPYRILFGLTAVSSYYSSSDSLPLPLLCNWQVNSNNIVAHLRRRPYTLLIGIPHSSLISNILLLNYTASPTAFTDFMLKPKHLTPTLLQT